MNSSGQNIDEAVANRSADRFALKPSLLWLGASLLAVLVLSVTASYVPGEMKRLLIFHAVFGVACGMVLLWLAAEIRPTWGKWLPLWGAMLCLAGAINMGFLSYQHFLKARVEYAAAHPRDAALQSMLEKLSENDPELKARYEEEHFRANPRFREFLSHRISSLGDWKSPWPQLFWGLELLMAAGLCGWTIAARSKSVLKL